MDLIMLYRALMRRKWYLILIPLFSAFLAIYFTRDFKTMFKSTAQISTGFTVSEQVSVTEERFNIFQADIKFNNLRELITSQRVFGLLSYQLLLHDLKEKTPPYRTIPDSKEKTRIYNAITKQEIIDHLEKKLDSMKLVDAYNDRERKILDILKLYEYDYRSLRKTVNVFRVEGTDYLQIVALTEKGTLSADMVNMLCEIFFRYYNDQQADKAGVSITSFRKLVEQKEKELEAAEETLRLFKTENGIINLDAASESKIGQITDLTNDKEEESQNIRAIRLELDKVNRELTKYAKGSGSNNTEILRIRNKINDLNRKYLEGGPNSKSIQDSLDYYKQRMNNIIPRGSNAALVTKKEDLETRLDIAEEHLSSINRRLYSLNNDIGTSASIQAKLANLEREVNRISEEYLSAQEKYNTAEDLAAVNLGAMRQVIIGQPPTEPEPSKRIIITALSGAATFVFCLILIIILEYIDISIKTPYNFQKLYEDVNLLGSLNKVKIKKGKGVDELMQKTDKKPKKYQKQFRELLRKVRFEINNADKKIILFTSNREGEGKSLLIEVMARGISVTRKKALIIDANFTNNTLTERLSAEPVLEEIASAEGEFDPAKHIVTTDIENIDIIGCSEGDYTPSEVLNFKKFKSLLEAVKESYDYIFIESSALNLYTDTKELSEFADGVVAIYSAESSVKELDRNSMEFLKSLNEKFLGVVLNKVKSEYIDQ